MREGVEMHRADLCEREQLALSRDRDPAVLPHRLVSSWKRSADYAVPLDAVNPAFVGDVDDRSLFYESGHQVLTELHQTLADEPVSLMLTDPDGLVLNRVCSDRFLLQALDDVRLAPGFDFSERKTGTTGLGLALADRVPTLVRADQHYSTSLWGYTCAAVPVADPVTGAMVGAVNLTTWSQQSYNLLLALAQTAARTTEALMLARGRGRETRPATRGRVVRVRTAVDDDSAPCLEDLGVAWCAAMDVVRAALRSGEGVAIVGEPGVGKGALLGGAHARTHRGRRVLHARPPEPEGVASWLALWSPELGKPGTSVIVSGVDQLPAWAATDLADLVAGLDGAAGLSVTAHDLAEVPDGLRAAVGTVVELPALRHRPGDVVPLASWFAREARGRAVRFAADAQHVLATYHWPGNVTQLREVVRQAVARTDLVSVRDLPPEVFTGAHHRLTRMETLERDEIVRALSDPGATAASAAESLGMSRSTIYRRIGKYGIRAPAGADQ
ncbi:GAF domain-containing protein [Actinomycetospora sp. NBC_00405]|uniref:GAF domain-containing protein n=1 Tax=Actinomycetospora sp. NBC_00405 TaxID=2975952 RepID=UPI002E1AB604